MPDGPFGTVTFVFTDVIGSTQLWDTNPVEMAIALRVHDQIIRQTLEAHGGVVFSTAGDSFAVAFTTARDGLRAAIELQQRLVSEPWPEPIALADRVGVHTGEAEVRDGNYFGGAVNRAARVMAIAKGGQILVSRATEELVADHLPGQLRLVPVGDVVLRGLERPEKVYQVVGPGLPSGFSPPEEMSGPVSLPRPVTTLFGRADEMARLEQYLARSQLVTVVGFGGVGKTRLATEVAHAISPNFRHGVWFCDLSSISAAEAVPSTVARAIGAVEEPGRTLPESIISRLSGAAALVLLDNCEHLLRSIAVLVNELIGGCRDLRIVATSRQPLGVAGEQVMPLGPLATDADDDPGVQLFVDRARHARPDFRLTDANRDDVRAVCSAVDGISLGIELAAARVRALSPSELAARLGDRFRLLGNRATGDARHRTLLSTVEWSYRLLAPAEQDLFDRLSVFAGRFQLAGAEAIGASEAIDRVGVDELLDALVDKSLVVAEHGANSTSFRLLDTLRQYGEQRLADRRLGDEVHRAHANYCGEIAQEIAWDWATKRQLEANVRMDESWANLREACSWATAAGELELGARILLPLFPVVVFRLAYEFGDWAARLTAVDAASMHPVTPQLLGFAATIRWFRADYDGVDDDTNRAVELTTRLGLPPHWLSTYGLSLLAYVRGDQAGLAAQVALPTSLVADRPPSGADPTLRVFHYYNRTNALTFLRCSTEDCVAAAQAAVAEAEASGSPGLLAVALAARAGQRVRQEPPAADEAWADARRAVALARHADTRYVFAIAMGYGLQAASLLEQPEGLDDVLPDLHQWAEIGVEIGNITHLWRFVASALGLLWRRGERALAIRVRATMDANPWRELGPVVERAVREIDLVVPEEERAPVEVSQGGLMALLHDVVEALSNHAHEMPPERAL